MRFWDASALVPLLINEPLTGRLKALGDDEVPMAVWWGTIVECTSALVRRERGGAISVAARDNGLAALAEASEYWLAVGPDAALRDAAVRAVRLHRLSAGDALQLAAALDWAGGRPVGHEFVTLDRELRAAASVEGFSVLPS